MTKRIVLRLTIWLTAAIAAFVAVGVLGPPPQSAEAVHAPFPEFNRGWCAYASGGDPPLTFTKITTHHPNVTIDTSGDAMNAICESKYGGTHMDTAEKNRLQGVFSTFSLPALTTAQDFPKKDWFAAPTECFALPNTIGAENRLQHVYIAKTTEIVLQIAYDVGSNEITGITGAILGAILGVSKTATFVLEWNYEVQDECQEILERRQIAEIYADTDRIITDVKTLLNDVSKHDTAISTATSRIITEIKELLADLEDHDDDLGDHDTALGTHDTALGDHDTALGDHDTALGDHDTAGSTDTARIIADVKELLSDLDTHDAKIYTDTQRIISDTKELLADLDTHDAKIYTDTQRIISDTTELLADLDTHDAKIYADTQRIISDTKQLLANSGDVQTTLDTTVEVRRVHLQVVRLLGTREFLVLADEGGVPVEVEFTSIQFSGDNTVEFFDVTVEIEVTVEKNGVYRLVVDSDSAVEGIRQAKIWEFQVEHDDGDHSHFGVVLFHENSIGNLGSGQ